MKTAYKELVLEEILDYMDKDLCEQVSIVVEHFEALSKVSNFIKKRYDYLTTPVDTSGVVAFDLELYKAIVDEGLYDYIKAKEFNEDIYEDDPEGYQEDLELFEKEYEEEEKETLYLDSFFMYDFNFVSRDLEFYYNYIKDIEENFGPELNHFDLKKVIDELYREYNAFNKYYEKDRFNKFLIKYEKYKVVKDNYIICAIKQDKELLDHLLAKNYTKDCYELYEVEKIELEGDFATIYLVIHLKDELCDLWHPIQEEYHTIDIRKYRQVNTLETCYATTT